MKNYFNRVQQEILEANYPRVYFASTPDSQSNSQSNDLFDLESGLLFSISIIIINLI